MSGNASGSAPGSATRTSESTAGLQNQGEFHSSRPREEPMTTHGHKPGVLASESDRAPEFNAKTLPAGSAPADRTFKPNPTNDAPPVANYMKDDKVEDDASQPSAQDTIGGATSADVHQGLGHPGQGQSSAELRHDGKSTQGVGNAGRGGEDTVGTLVDKHDPLHADQRALDKDEASGTSVQGVPGRGNDQTSGAGGASAEERVPETSDTAAREANR
ncbi:hypothetical protein LTS18_006042 [Coniosporium uncinatum]|uniref:Uncharacterized protein n=1 Tax=Coniosporium uncinatum TaxID=93489 RepID=A0ACC3DR22_9PEZI|nr:hypothetical protein LTS18_006042 [Coniosporium uncinatum]